MAADTKPKEKPETEPTPMKGRTARMAPTFVTFPDAHQLGSSEVGPISIALSSIAWFRAGAGTVDVGTVDGCVHRIIGDVETTTKAILAAG